MLQNAYFMLMTIIIMTMMIYTIQLVIVSSLQFSSILELLGLALLAQLRKEIGTLERWCSHFVIHLLVLRLVVAYEVNLFM